MLDHLIPSDPTTMWAAINSFMLVVGGIMQFINMRYNQKIDIRGAENVRTLQRVEVKVDLVGSNVNGRSEQIVSLAESAIQSTRTIHEQTTKAIVDTAESAATVLSVAATEAAKTLSVAATTAALVVKDATDATLKQTNSQTEYPNDRRKFPRDP